MPLQYESNFEEQSSNGKNDHGDGPHESTPSKSMGAAAMNITETSQIQTLVKQELGVSTGTESTVLVNGRGTLPDLEILKQAESQKQLKGLFEQL